MTWRITTNPGRPELNRGGKTAPPGPWWGEPDRVQWTDPTGLECEARRGPFGAWNGYVGVPKGHPLYRVGYDELGVEVHGGLTFAGTFSGSDLWWFGFDCAHAGDVVPSHLAYGFGGDREEEVYRRLPYVREQVIRLARWIAARGWPDTDDPNAPCMCGHVLITHRPPLFGCLAYSKAGDEWHGCPCERFLAAEDR